MSELSDILRAWWHDDGARAALVGVIILVVGLVVARIVSGVVARVLGSQGDAQRAMVVRRLVFGVLGGIVTAAALQHAGVDMSVFFGAAGILTVAFGFASQTSMSNLISGAFLIGERAFVVGDLITVGATTGEVLSIDLLSVKLRTLENLYVRVPNETLIKSDIVNLSRFPIRRVELDFRFGLETDLGKLAKLLNEVAYEVPICLVEPRPQFYVQDFTDVGVWVKFRFWCRREVFLDARARIQAEAQRRFREEGVRQPVQRVRMEPAESVTAERTDGAR